MDDDMRRRLTTLKERGERAGRKLQAFNSYLPLIENVVKIRGISEDGLWNLLPKDVVTDTFLGITLGHHLVPAGTHADAEKKLIEQFRPIADQGCLDAVADYCAAALEGRTEADDQLMVKLEGALLKLEQEIEREIHRQNEAIDSNCKPFRRR